MSLGLDQRVGVWVRRQIRGAPTHDRLSPMIWETLAAELIRGRKSPGTSGGVRSPVLAGQETLSALKNDVYGDSLGLYDG